MAERDGECQLLLWTCADSEWRRSVQKTYAEEVKVHEVFMLSRLTGRRFTEWSWLHALMICLHLSEIWRVLNWELDPMMWLWLMCKESLLGNLGAWSQRQFVSQESAFFCCEQILLQSFCKDKIFEWDRCPTISYICLKYTENILEWHLSINYLHYILVEREHLWATNIFLNSSILNCNANKISWHDRSLSEFYCIQTAMQTHILNDDDL